MEKIPWLCLFFLLPVAGVSGKPLVGFSGEYGPGEKAVHIMSFAVPGVDVSVLHRGCGGVPDYSRFILACSGVHLGSMSPCGLSRELGNPTGYSPYSTVYAERSGYFYNPGMTRSGLLGGAVYVGETSRMINLPIILFPQLQTGLSGYLAFPGGRLTGAVLYSRTEEPEAEQTWFARVPVVASQDILHGAAALDVSRGFLSLSAAAGFASPEYLEQGWFLRCRARAATGFLDALILAAGCTDSYLTPSGRFPADQFHYGASVTLFPKSHFRWVFDLERELRRLDLVPDVDRGVREKVTCSLVMDSSPWLFRESFARYVTWNPDSSGGLTDIFTLKLGRELSFGNLAGEFHFRIIDGWDRQMRGRLEAGVSMKGLSGRLTVLQDSKDGFGLRFSGSVKAGKLLCTVSADLEGVLRVGFTFDDPR